ncbi:MAG TPA: flagellar M-ring protein FliF C-terminal domain-containing protein, partial [Candidatus Rubrimentiphilum sp.]|nr:flagellar M-ring protein FliF C-terminal domain-containing protein [Candidatus Rubrimentiphilum sp.]
MQIAVLLDRWNALPRVVRVSLSLAVAAFVTLSIFASLLSHPQRMQLFSTSLHAEQLSEVEERLASWNVAFTPTSDNVFVETKQRSDLLLRLSLAGVPHVHVDDTTDLLGKIGALTPQTVIDAQTRDGLAGDIELGLRGIEGVQEARVIIAPAKAAYFADESSRDASASVRLRLVPGMHLSPDAIGGIRSFVAASVAGLDPTHVTIVDDRGVALGNGAEATDASELQHSLQSALDSAIGAGAAIVRVHVEYDSRAVSSSTVRRLPVGNSAIASNTQRERFTGDGKHYDRADEQVDRGSEERRTTSSLQPGRVARITAAVFVDALRGADLYQVRALAAATLGIDPHRGDSLEVGTISFAHAAVPKKDGWWLAYGAIAPLLPTLIVGLVILAVLRWSRAPVMTAVRALTERLQAKRELSSAIPAAKV